MKNKSILVLTPRFPYPAIGGDRLRIYSQCAELSKYYNVTLLSLCESKLEMEYSCSDDGVFNGVERVYLPKWKSYLTVLLNLFAKQPMQISYYQSSAFAAKVEALSASHDLLFCHLIRTGQYARKTKIANVLEMTDAISMNYKRIKDDKSIKGIKAAIYKMELDRLEAYENQIINDFDICSLISHVDRDYIYKNSLHLKNSIVSGGGVHISNYPYQFLNEVNSTDQKRIVFVGMMTTLQNFDAAFWFAKNVLPLLRKNDDYIFEIVGKINSENFKALKDIPGVKVTGLVESISETLKGALVGVCPMRIGAGVQGKVLEYMSLGLPCIISPLAFEGINARKDIDLVVANTSEEYVNSILKFSVDREYAENMAIAARKVIEDQYSWEKQLEPLINAVKKILPSNTK
jgi:glycosyltransferase involved in cell wall biosynthesis